MPSRPTDRFYDQEPLTSATVALMEQFTPDLQGVIANGLCLIAVKDFQVDQRIYNQKSAGPDLIMSLHKSKQKRRSYDVNPDFHNSVNYLKLLNPAERQQVAVQVLEIARCTQQFLEICDGASRETVQTQVTRIRDVYIAEGADATRNFVGALCEALSMQKKKAVNVNVDAGSRIKPAPEP